MTISPNAAGEMIQIGAFKLFAKIDGEASKPWLVLGNSLASDHTLWDGQISVLTRTHRVLRFDARGHGSSDAPDGAYSLGDLIGDVVALMDHFAIRESTFMGISLGGMVGLGLALNYPGRVQALICCDARADAPPAFVGMWETRIAEVRQSGIEPLVVGTIDRWLSEPFRHLHPEAVNAAGAMIRRTTIQGYAGCASALKTLDYLPKLSHIGIPVLFVVGDEDQAAPPSIMKDMADRVPGSQLALIPAAAHLPNLDSPEAFAAAISPFLMFGGGPEAR